MSDSDKNAQPVVELADVHLAFGEKEVLTGVNLRARAARTARHARPVRRREKHAPPAAARHPAADRRLREIQRPRGLRNEPPRLNRIRQKIGMVYQYSALISSLNVRDNLALPLEELTDKSHEEIDEIVDGKARTRRHGGDRARKCRASSAAACASASASPAGSILDPGAHPLRRTQRRSRSRDQLGDRRADHFASAKKSAQPRSS